MQVRGRWGQDQEHGQHRKAPPVSPNQRRSSLWRGPHPPAVARLDVGAGLKFGAAARWEYSRHLTGPELVTGPDEYGTLASR